MKLRSILGGAVVGLALLVPAPADAAVSAQVTETGWWSQRPGATPKEGKGVEVAAALGNAQSVAALRIVVSGGEVTTATLTLEETGGVGQETAQLTVCPTTKPWKPANPGPYAEAPEPNCDSSVELTRAADGKSWTADIGILLSGPQAALVIVPGTGGPSGLPVGPGYQVAFGKATVQAAGGDPSSIGLAPPVPSGTEPTDFGGTDPGDTGGGTSVEPQPATSGGSSFETPAPSDPSLDTSTPAPEAPAAEAPTATGAVEVPLDTGASGGGDASGAPEGIDTFAAGPVAADGGTDPLWGRLVFLLPFCAIVGAGVAYGRTWLREHGYGRFLPS